MNEKSDEQIKKVLSLSGVPKRYLGVNFKTLDKEMYASEVSSLRDYMENQTTTFFKGKGIVFFGNTGVGKTFFMVSICRWLAENNRKFRYYKMMDFVELYETQGEIEEGRTFWDVVKSVDALFIDDLNLSTKKDYTKAKGVFEVLDNNVEGSLYTQKTIRTLRHVLNTRKDLEKPVFIATQLKGGAGKSFRVAFSDITVDLLESICDGITFDVTDKNKTEIYGK